MAVGGFSLMIDKTLYGLGYFFKTFVLKKEVPCLFGMVITDKCNLDCFYCESKNSGRYHFSFEQAKNSMRDAFQRGHRTLYFTGGEPMVWEDNGHNLGELVAFARDLGFLEVFIYTNGTQPLLIEQCKYVVTIDGPKDVHDQIRCNSYDLVLENVKNAATKTIFATITLTKANAEFLDRYVKEITDTRLFKRISFNLLTHWPEIVEKHGLSMKERKKLLDKIWQLSKDGYPIALSGAAYKALKNNDWKRPIPQIELGTKDKVFTCCRDVDNPSICENCGYVGCVEVSQVLALKPSAIWQALRVVNV
jgi:MoaA/NifB/PqqE/SkfB family radical SAM enzyme